MNRTLSRGLVGLCLITLVLGGSLYLLHAHHTKAVAAKTPIKATSNDRLPPAMMTGGNGTAPAVGAGGLTLNTTTQPTTAPSVASTKTPQSPVGTKAHLVSDTAGGANAVTAAWSPTASSVPAAPPSNFIAAATAKADAGDPLAARKMLNDALLSGKLNAYDTEATKKSITDLNNQIIFSAHRYTDDEYGGVHLVKPGEMLKKIAFADDIPWQFLAQINNLSDPRKMKSGVPLKIIKGPFTLVVTKHAFTMDLYLGGTPGQVGSMYVRTYPVGLGKEDSTPTGTWMVGTKAKDPVYYSPRGEGVMAADDPKNPLGHRWISIVGMDGKAVGAQSYGIHGTIDPDSIGKMASMGCIRMHNEDVAVVFDLLAENKSIVIVRD